MPQLCKRMAKNSITEIPLARTNPGPSRSRTIKKRTICSVKGELKQIQQVRTPTSKNLLTITINGQPAKALIDSGADSNLISQTYVQQKGLSTHLKEVGYGITTIDGTPIGKGRIDQEVTAMLEIQQHIEWITLDVAPITGEDVILGQPWLIQNNPQINWKEQTFRFPKQHSGAW